MSGRKMTPERAATILEAALLTSPEPLGDAELARLFDEAPEAAVLAEWLESVSARWTGRGLELVKVAGGWRFRSRAELRPFLDRLADRKPPRYSRAALETLAIIAYRQPVTRGDIEEIRGVAVSSQILKSLEARGWIESVGHREIPGRPALYATTVRFLNDLNLASLSDLPPLREMETLLG